MRHLRLLVLTVAALGCFVPGRSFASSARIDGLGLQSDYVQDYVNVWHYPSTIGRYQNLVYGDLGIKDEDGGDLDEFEDNGADVPELQNSARAMGAFLKLWKGMPGTLGIALNENASPVSPAYGADYWNRSRNESFNLAWGDELGDGDVAIGFQVNRIDSQVDDDGDIISPSDWTPPPGPVPGSNSREFMNNINAALGLEGRNSFGVGGGVSFGWDGGSRHHTADIAVQYRSLSLELATGAPGARLSLEDDGGMALAVNARAQYATSDNTYLTPVLNYWSMDMSTEFTDEATPANNASFDNTVSGWNIGLAESWVLRENDLLTLGFAFQNESIEYSALDADISYTTTPQLFGAAEIHPMNWLHVRFGASKSLTSKLEIEDTAAGTTLEISDSPLGYTVGAGFRIGGRLDLDAVINQDFAFTGGWAASGNQEVPFSRLSATYRW